MKRRRPLLGTSRTVRALLLLGTLLTLIGCPKQPQMRLYGAGLGGIPGPQGIPLSLSVEVKNPNGFDVQVRNVRVSMLIEKKYQLPPIVYSPNVWLRAGTATIVRVPITIPWHMIQPLGATTVGSSIINYRVMGDADVTATSSLKIDDDDYEIDDKGQMNRNEVLGAALRGGIPGLPFGR
ncbi:MAG: hypothetical protein AAGA56_15015 [Myxococcota bacterium]